MNPFALEPAVEGLVLPVREAVDGFRVDGIIRTPLRKLDPAAGEERVGAHEARLAVEVAVVVAPRAERTERTEALPGELQPPREEVVETVSPRCGVYLRARRQDSVEIEQARSNAYRQPSVPAVARVLVKRW